MQNSSGSGIPVGSGALSHAYVQYPPLRFNMPGAAGLMYDDGNKLLLVPLPNKVLAWAVNQKVPGEPVITNFAEGPVLFVRLSLDETILAVQRSSQEVEFVNRETGAVFRQSCKQGTDQIFGLFWIDCPTCEVVFVTSSGLELYSLSRNRAGLKLVEVKKQNVSWYVYTHESRLVLLSSGMQCKTLSGYQFAAGGIIRLPKFDVAMAKTEVNSKPVLAFEDVHIATMYGRLFCLQVDRVAMELHIYRFYRDAVEPQGLLPIYSSHVALSVVDNVLLIHEIDSKVVLLYDIMASSRIPVSAPLPLLVKGVSLNTSSRIGVESGNAGSAAVSSADADQFGSSSIAETTVYDSGWAFANPNIVLDRARGLLWKLQLDLEAISASSSDILSLLAFLQRRSHEAGKAKRLSMEAIRSMIIERQPLPLIARAMDVLTSSYARAVKLGTESDRYPANKSAQPSQAGGSKVSASFNVPREFDVTAATMPDSVIQAVQTTGKSKKEPSVVQVDVDADRAGWIPGSQSQRDGNSRDAASAKAERTTSNSSMAEGSGHEESQRRASMAASSTGESEIDVLTMLSSHGHPSGRGGLTGESSQQSHTEMFVTEFSEQKGRTVSPSLSPEEMHYSVFNVIEKDMIVDSSFVLATIVEYLQSAASEHVRVNPGLYVLVVQLLAQQQQYSELWQLIAGKVVPPSRAVAFQLLEVGNHNVSTRKLGMDMLRQLHAHTDYVNFLLQEGRVLEAICHVRQTKVQAFPPAVFLEAAKVLKDPQKLASVFRYCLDSIPDFEKSTDFSTYISDLRQQSTVSN